MKRTVNWTETDLYKHTNYVVYMKYCFETAMDAIQHGFYKHFSDDINLYLLKDVRMTYRSECLGGEELLCKTWEDPEKPLCLHFDVSRDNKTIYQATLEFNEGHHQFESLL